MTEKKIIQKIARYLGSRYSALKGLYWLANPEDYYKANTRAWEEKLTEIINSWPDIDSDFHSFEK